MNALSTTGLPLVFFAGLASSAGPCVAPRFITVAGLCANRGRITGLLTAAAFAGGLACAFAVFGAGGALLMSAVKLSTGAYVLLAVALAAGGLVTLLKADACSVHRTRKDAGALGAGFLLGACSAFVVSPCCTPVLLAIAAYSAAANAPLSGAVLCAVYAAGHGLPLLAAALGARSISTLLERFAVRRAAATVSGAIMLALAGYYAVIA